MSPHHAHFPSRVTDQGTKRRPIGGQGAWRITVRGDDTQEGVRVEQHAAGEDQRQAARCAVGSRSGHGAGRWGCGGSLGAGQRTDGGLRRDYTHRAAVRGFGDFSRPGIHVPRWLVGRRRRGRRCRACAALCRRMRGPLDAPEAMRGASYAGIRTWSVLLHSSLFFDVPRGHFLCSLHWKLVWFFGLV
jgi:hypothetical protein